jgi:hypothetical protein
MLRGSSGNKRKPDEDGAGDYGNVYDDYDDDDDDLLFDPGLVMAPVSLNQDMFEDIQTEQHQSGLHGVIAKRQKNPVTAPPHAAKYEIIPSVPVKSEKHAMDSVCFHSQTALITFLWLNVTQGVTVPGLIDEEKQKL